MDKKAVRAWVMYDWANSAFAIIIMTAIMPIFYADVAGKGLDGSTTTALWGYTQSLGTLFVVLLSPVLGAIADKAHSKKKFLAFFTYMGVIATLLMWFIGEGQWVLASFLVILGTLAFSGGTVFYDAFLSDLVPEEKRDMVSSQGYAAGYIGGGLILILDLAIISYPQAFLLPSKLFATQLSFALVGIWWLVFSIPFFRHVREKGSSDTVNWKDMKTLAREGFESVKQTLMEIGRYPELLKFLIAFWFFSDGIDTIVKMAAIYGREVGVGQNDLILALICLCAAWTYVVASADEDYRRRYQLLSLAAISGIAAGAVVTNIIFALIGDPLEERLPSWLWVVGLTVSLAIYSQVMLVGLRNLANRY